METISAIIFLIGLVFYPQLNEEVSNNCQALEKKYASTIIKKEMQEENIFVNSLVSSLVNSYSNGEFAKILVKEKFPNLPPFLGCSILYYTLNIKNEQKTSTKEIHNKTYPKIDNNVGPSFNCKHSKTLTENLICSSKELSELDLNLVQTYKNILNTRADDAPQLKEEQRNWRENTRNKCEDIECLIKVYNERISELN